ncbi:MAG TPA: glycosyltransferase family 39 protein, partial [Chloroflexia bacterium]|nr:glycosyltransferase family 39 protein [Chloroflexia bacterium]
MGVQPEDGASVKGTMKTATTDSSRPAAAVASRSNATRPLRLPALSAVLGHRGVQIGALSLLALLLRRYHLGDESLWFDEADIVARAGQPLGELARGFTQAGENGPLYTLLLHFWLGLISAIPPLQKALHILFGASYEGPVRGLAMLFGAGAVPLIYLLGRKIGGHLLGLLAAILLAINPFHIWHSQDAKMYSLLVLLTIATTLLYIEAWERNRVVLWAGFVVCTWIMLTTHSMAALVLLAQIAAAPFLARVQRSKALGGYSGDPPESAVRYQARQRWVGWGWAMLLVLTPLFPIASLRIAALVTNTADLGGWYSPASLPDIIGTIGVTFAVNRAPELWEAVGALALALLAAAGVASFLSKSSPNTESEAGRNGYAPLVVALVVLPLSVFWLVTLKVPLFQARYLIMSLPPYLLLASAGLLYLRRFHATGLVVATIGAGLLGVSTFAALTGVNYSVQVQKEDWRGAMVYVQDHLRLRDEIVVFPGYLATAVDVYYRPGVPAAVPHVPVHAVPSLSVKNFGQRELETELRRVIKCQERAWLVLSPVRARQEDPESSVEQWFAGGNWHVFDRKEFNGITVYGISFNGQPDCWYPNPDFVELHRYENGLTSLGYIYELRGDSSSQPDASYFPLTTYW